MSGSMVEVLKTTTPRMGRRSMALADIDPKYVSQSGIWEASEVETSKGSIRIQHLTAVATSLRSVSSGSGATSIVGCGPPNNPRFPKLEECAHFHYDYVELPVLKILIREDTSKPITLPVDESTDKCAFAIEVSAGGQSWVIRRTHANFILLDEQLHRCVWDRSFSRLEQLKESLTGSDGVAPLSSSNISNKGKRQASNSCANINAATSAAAAAAASRRRTTSAGGGAVVLCEGLVGSIEDSSADHHQQNNSQQNDHPDEEHNGCRDTIIRYLSRLAQLPTNKITCGTVLSWLELDNRGRHIVSSDDSDINTPAVAAACAVRKYLAQAADEIAFEVGDMISVIDMPPPEESIWWRGKRGFHVGFFPRECVQVIGDKVPAGLPIVSSVRRLQRLSVSSAPSTSSSSSSSASSAPEKPVLRKHGKLIAFFRSFILSRPSRRRLKQSGILRERVFSCDLAEHLLNTGNDIPAVLKCCAEFIEKRGIVDGIYRLSGITSNIQKLRNLFDEDKIPNLEDDMAIKQDIHAVSSLLKMYFRELPNPLCTYQLYDKFVAAAQASDEERLFKMREVVHELPPPHYRTLEYLMKHLSRVAERSKETGMTPKNMAIVWAPNILSAAAEYGVDALKGIGLQAVITEYLVRHAVLIFNDKLPANYPITTTVLSHKASCSASGRPKSLAISSPIRLMSLEEAQQKQDDRKYIEVGGGPSSLPPKYHTVIDLPSRRSALKNKRSPIGWRQFFSRNRSFSKPSSRKISNPIEITVVTGNMPMAGPQGMQSNWVGRLRPVKSVESLVSSPMYTTNVTTNGTCEGGHHHLDHESVLEDAESSLSKSSPATPVMTDVDVIFHAAPVPPSEAARPLQNPKTHNRSISHDSYFEFGEFRNSNRVYIDETLEEETLSQSSKLSLEISSGGECSPTRKNAYAKDQSSNRGKSGDPRRHGCMMSPVTPPPSAASLVVPTSSTTIMSESVTSTSSDDVVSEQYNTNPKSPLLPSKWRDSEVQTSHTKLYDVGVSTTEDMDQCANPNPVMISASTTTTSLTSSGGGRTTTTTTTSCPVTRDSSEQSLISHSSGGGCEPMYELDRNSSIDDSSVDSTPCEPFASTNIIYSPLIDDLSSPASSGDHFRLGMDPFRVPSSADSEDASSANHTSTSSSANVVKQQQGSILYVSPLYEAGVTTAESIISSAASAGTEVTEVNNSSASGSVSPRVHQYENVSVLNTHNRQPNLQVFLCSSTSSQNLQQQQTAKIPASASVTGHIYENQRLYENQPAPVPAIRKSKSEGAVMQAALAQQQQNIARQQSTPTPVTPVAVVSNVQVDSDSVYEKAPEHYENISEIEVKPAAKEDVEAMDDNEHLSHEANIYEDIDDDEDVDRNTGNKYETVEFEKGIMRSKESTPTSLSARPVDDSEDEYEKVQESPVVIHHHYAEIEEKMDTNCASPDPQPQTSTTTLVVGGNPSSPTSPQQEGINREGSGASSLITVIADNNKSGESSPSHSNTEDMVTYLEVQTPHLNLRNNSLDDQEELSQRSGISTGESKLSKMNSLNSNGSSGGSENSPPGDEGEIRHIDSPVNSPVIRETTPAPTSAPATTVGVDNPLYGIQQDEDKENIETKDLEMQMSDGEDMSVNESISISISMEETTTPSSSAGKRKQEGLSSTQNTSQDSGEIQAGRELKLVSRCNSAPLAVGVHEFTLALSNRNEGIHSLEHGAEMRGGEGDDDDVFLNARAPAARSNSSTYGEAGGDGKDDDEVERRFGDKVLLCKRLSEPSLLFSNTNGSSASGSNLQKTDSSDDSNNLPNNIGGGSGGPGGNNKGPNGGQSAAWKIADAKRLANRKKSVRELLSKFESRDSVSSTSPVQSPTSNNNQFGSLPPTGLSGSRSEIGNSNNNIQNGGRSSSNNNLSNSGSSSSNNNGNARFHHHRFSTGDILMTQSMSVVENLSSMLTPSMMSASSNENHLPSTNIIVRSDTFPELSRDDSASKENALHGTFSVSERNGDDQHPEKSQSALRVAMSSVDMNDPSRRERIEKYKEERRSFLRQKISSELTSTTTTHQQKSPMEQFPPMNNGQIFPPTSTILLQYSPDNSLTPTESSTDSGPPSSNFSGTRVSESPRKRAFSEDGPIGGLNNTTNKSIKTDPFSLKCAFLASTTTTTTSTKMMESSRNSTTATSTETVSSTTVLSSKSVETAEEINVRERVALWSNSSSQAAAPKKEASSPPQPVVVGGGSQSQQQQQRLQSSTTTFTLPISTSNSQNQLKGGSLVSTSTTEFPKVCKPLLRRELTTSAIEISSQTKNSNNCNKLLTKVGRTNSEGTKKIKDMAAFFEGKQF